MIDNIIEQEIKLSVEKARYMTDAIISTQNTDERIAYTTAIRLLDSEYIGTYTKEFRII